MLKPGSSYVIAEDVAAAEALTSDTPSLHWTEPAPVRWQVETANFALDAEGTLLVD